MADTFPTTPSARTGPSSGSRHLKRLSLAASSPASLFSPGSPSGSPASSTTNTSPAVSLSRENSAKRSSTHGVRGLRLSLSGNLPPACSASPSSASPLASSTSPAPCQAPFDGPSIVDSPTLSRRSSYRASSIAPGTPPLEGARTPLSSHARRTSSISYAKSPVIGTGPERFPDEAGGSASGSPALGSTRTSLEGGRPSLALSLGGLPEELAEEEEAEGESSPMRSHPASGAAASQATIIEQNVDLLSFIAKKERKCLDLREELKRHEAELTLLKKKWESIVARSLQQQLGPSSSSNPSHSARHAPSHSISTISSASPNSSPTPRSSAILHPAHTTHSLDLSLLSSTFDASELLGESTVTHGSGAQTPPLEIPESLKAAGSWLGGALGRALEVAVGMPPPLEDIQRREREVGGLESLKEEEEEGDEEDRESKRRRESKGSSVETDLSGTSATGGRSTAPSSVTSDDTVSPQLPCAASSHPQQTPIKPSPLRAKPTPPRSSSPLASRRTDRLFTSPPPASPSASASASHPFPSSSPPTASSHSHGRSRSSLDALSSGWSSLNKKWTHLTESETFKNSKRATMDLVDTFEQGLAQALGPLEPPSLRPVPQGPDRARGVVEVSSPLLAASSPSPSPSLSPILPPTQPSPSPATRHAPLPDVPIAPVPGQVLSSVFASWSKGSQPAAPATAAVTAAQQEKRRGGGGQNWDWSAFGATGSVGDDEAHDKDKADRKGKERERGTSGVDDEWPAWQ
ncbi:hypothetical protein JCM1840_002108 [Sporobolomyces johnsonii]